MFRRGGIWWTCIRHKGVKIQKSLETADKRLAKDIESKVRVELKEEKFFDKRGAGNKIVADLMDKFLNEHASTVTVNTRKSYNTSLLHLLPFFGNSLITAVDRKMISKYRTHRKSEGAKPASVNREMSMLSKALNLAVTEWEWIENCPKFPKEKENNEIDRYLSDDEESILLSSCDEWLKDLIVFALNTGLRQDEQLSLEWSRVSLERKTILIQETKSGKPRSIPLNQAALEILARKSKIRSLKHDLVFLSSSGTKVNNCNLARSFNRALKRAGIKKVNEQGKLTWHGLRRTFATRLVQKGIDIYKVAGLLGHSDVRMTQKRYAHHSPESLRSGVEILDVDYNLTTMTQKAAIL